eukprot:GFUD01005967.1.p1 GENE.GFUD01005967.1~~GFUD01005967.1.p1  ORF type:complete len:442 (-),score=152.13 GFUD01005967.1:334-1659(-)
MADVDQRFFCHQCSVEIPRIAADFTCPTCNSGFIEELGQAQPPPPQQPDYDDDDEEPYDLGQVLGPLEALLPGLLGGGARGFRGGGIPRGAGLGGPMRPRQHRIRIARGAPNRAGGPQNLGMDQAALENALQDFIVNLAGMEFGGAAAGPGAQFHFIGPGAGGPLGAGGGFHLHGNPGDYAWGRGGLDAIITQLLNHMDGAGPPPMAKENIQEIPTVNISKEQMEKSQSCSVCWEDFTEGEQVKLLECEHCFHSPCIVPWLELHGTCPVCRKELGKNGQAQPGAAAGAGGVPGGEPEAAADGAEGGDPSSSSTTTTTTTPHPAMQSSVSQSMSPGGTTTQSVTVSGTAGGAGGLTGLIQSALNQVFSANWSSQPNPGPSSSNREPETPASSSSTTTQPGVEGGGGRSGGGNGGSQSSTSDDDTPATRRQRLDSEFVDLDFD